MAGRNPKGETFRTLGLGPLFGDWGSASEVSQAAVSAVADAHTGRGPKTELTDRLCEAAGMESVVDFLEGAGRLRIDTVVFAPLVVGAAESGDDVAQGILRRAGEMLGATTAHVVRTLEMVYGSIPLDAVFGWTTYLLLSIFPASIYWSARRFGFDQPTAPSRHARTETVLMRRAGAR